MARQKGPYKLKGSMGDISFYKTAEGYMVREKGGVDAKRIATDPKFQRTRENGSEFGRAGLAGKLFRTAFRSSSINTSDTKMSNRLTQLLMKVIHADTTSIRGERNVVDGNIELLQGFEFNMHSKLAMSFCAPYKATIVRATGATTIVIPPYLAETMVVKPEGATHYKLLSAGVAINFKEGTYEVDVKNSELLPVGNITTEALTLSNALAAGSTDSLFLAFGIDFYQEVNDSMYALKNGAFNALAIVKVSGM